MRPLFLDYRRDDPTQHRIGMLVLVLAIAAAVSMGLYYYDLSGKSELLEERLTASEHKLHPGRSGAMASAADARQTVTELKAANEVVLQMSLPWNKLFNALEEANSSDIALLGIEPNAQQRSVRLSGEAKNSAAMFAYIRALQASKSMSGVYLKHQQVQERNPEKPIRFTLDASWT